MEHLSIYIVDDQEDTAKFISSFIGAIPGVSLIGHETDPIVASRKLLSKELKPDIVLVDIEMPGLNGIQLGEMLLRGTNCRLIFITGHENYPRQVFDLDAADFITKPISLTRFLLAISKAKKLLGHASNATQYGQLFIPGNGKGNYFSLSTDNIRYIKGDSSYSYIYLVGKENNYHYTHYPIKDLEGTLDTNKFLRVSRSYIINISRISNINSKAIELDNGVEIQIGDTYRSEVKRRLALR